MIDRKTEDSHEGFWANKKLAVVTTFKEKLCKFYDLRELKILQFFKSILSDRSLNLCYNTEWKFYKTTGFSAIYLANLSILYL